MTKIEAEEMVRDSEDGSDIDVESCFAAIFGRQPDSQDREEGLWNHCCAAVE